jgi:hypothetical protein
MPLAVAKEHLQMPPGFSQGHLALITIELTRIYYLPLAQLKSI